MGFKSSPHRLLVSMSKCKTNANSARRFHCAKCRVPVIVCRQCDHGQQYCFNGCAQLAREESLKRAGKKYQQTRQGKIKNAARQQKFRDKQKQIVTHQGSAPEPPRAELKSTTKQAEQPTNQPKSPTSMVCHQCGCPCDPFFRLGFLNNNRFVGKPFINRRL